jgi:hypothetical protein
MTSRGDLSQTVTQQIESAVDVRDDVGQTHGDRCGSGRDLPRLRFIEQ